ncbi:DHHW family protein [Allofournierella massiliensis]|uniref:DHHW family protein n=1 Tax=Allofournierella massiliensis TaxID=1650663 RepID=A0ABT7UNF1_9FIRM|nr:DHHW family protein [Fournierella massiliensis]MDM8200422.1 DHHW family protein [Fournierella massiliensis]
MKEKFKELKQYPLLVLFFLFIFCFMIADGLWPKRAESDLERRDLAQFPKFSFSSLVKNEWTAKYGEYTKDQVIGRDSWLKAQSLCESLLFRKEEIGGAMIGKNDALFTKMFALTPTEEKLLQKNTTLVQQFIEKFPGQVTFLLAPSSSVINAEELPANTPMLDENARLDTIFSTVGEANSLDLREPFTAAKDDVQLYYDTDHHWTSYGAYLAYQQFCQMRGLTPMEVSESDYTTVPGFYGTTYSKALYWKSKPDTIAYLDLPNAMTVWNVSPTFELTENFTATMYDKSKLETGDKYAMFLYGNNGYSTIEGDGEGSILVVKDSYANSFIPYLTANYARIGVIDPRGFGLSVADFAQQEGYDEVLLLFNFQSFKESTFLSCLNITN